MKTIHINVKDDYVDNVVMMLNGLKNIMIDTIELEDDLKINKQHCLNTLEKIKIDGLAGFNPIVDVESRAGNILTSIEPLLNRNPYKRIANRYTIREVQGADRSR